MMKTGKKLLAALTLSVVALQFTYAGNGDRAGSAGSTDLLINPWARSSGWAGANTAFSRGLESQFTNVAGMAFTKKTEIIFAHSMWLAGTGINIESFGFSQNLGAQRGVIGVSVMSLNSGKISETTVNQPEGTGNTYQVSNLNIAVSYSRAFSKKISGGFTMRIITQGLSNVNSTGFAIDAGIQYKTKLGKRKIDGIEDDDNLFFGITLKNIGPRMRANGDGLSTQFTSPIYGSLVTVEQRSAEYEMPALMNIGVGYIYRFNKSHHLDFAFNFTTHSFTYDQWTLGAQYSFKDMLMIRGGYTFEEGIFGNRTGATPTMLNAFVGPTAGLTFEAPFKKGGNTKIGFDYSFRATYNFGGVHTFGARFTI
jgi:hypothetical protein